MEEAIAPSVQLSDVHKSYGSVEAVRGVSFSCHKGEFLTLLGPSGSGKTSILRMIAGFEHPTRAELLAIGGRSVLGIPAFRRDVTTVFQYYALFPHMTVGQNVEYGLKVRGVSAEERRRKAQEALDMARLGHTYGRKVNQLSGGEQQRVALARALVTRPSVLLLDEPLGALDEKLRRDMQVELKMLQRQVGTSFIYVTHDQQEALSMSDRIVVMSGGLIEQIGSPEEVYEFPATRFVAEFLGTSNLLPGTVAGVESKHVVVNTEVGVLRAALPSAGTCRQGEQVWLSVRSERLTLRAWSGGEGTDQGLPGPNGLHAVNCLRGVLRHVVYKGGASDVAVALKDGSQLRAVIPVGTDSIHGDGEVMVSWSVAATRILAR